MLKDYKDYRYRIKLRTEARSRINAGPRIQACLLWKRMDDHAI